MPLIAAMLAILFGATACGNTWGQRAVTGGAIGAGSGAAIGAVSGVGVLPGAFVGGAVGAGVGAFHHAGRLIRLISSPPDYGRRPARYDQFHRQGLHDLVALIERLAAHRDHPAVGARFRRRYLQHFALHP